MRPNAAVLGYPQNQGISLWMNTLQLRKTLGI
jgi:hypothetical protein